RRWNSLARLGASTHWFSFFFQAEDGIRDLIVTGVQTCALPISLLHLLGGLDKPTSGTVEFNGKPLNAIDPDGYRAHEIGFVFQRSEERRVGKECRSRRSGDL